MTDTIFISFYELVGRYNIRLDELKVHRERCKTCEDVKTTGQFCSLNHKLQGRISELESLIRDHNGGALV